MKYLLIIIGLLFTISIHAQDSTGVLKGTVLDKETGETLPLASVKVIGTYYSSVTDMDGGFRLKLKPGDYSLKVVYVGYADLIINGIEIKSGKSTTVKAEMVTSAEVLDEVVIVGKKAIVNLETGQSEVVIDQEELKEMNTEDVQDVAALQNGVSKSPDGLQIRGGRVYENQYVVDGVNAQDPLSGTGFGVEVSTGAVDEFEVITGGADAEYGDGSSGVLITKLREGGDSLQVAGSWQRDNLGWNPENAATSWNTDNIYINLGTPLNKKKTLTFFAAAGLRMTDTYFGAQANQLHSSIAGVNDSIWAPRQNNKWENTLKLAYEFKPGRKLTISNQHSLNINQNTRSLQIVGNDVVVRPGFQYNMSLDLDNANTYTHRSNLTAINYRHSFNDKWRGTLTLGRLFVNLRADANGRPFRDETADQWYDPMVIWTDPITVYNPGDPVVYVNAPIGLVNNGGIATLWHDHFVSEYTFKPKVTFKPNNTHFFTGGIEHVWQHFQWIDVERPWLGAPIVVNDTLTIPSTRIGESSEIWEVKPQKGGIFFQDDIHYNGLVANLGLRFNYWAPGRYIDEAIANENTPILDTVRDSYLGHTSKAFGLRWKARLLPRIRVSFPVRDNHVMYFNYGHAMKLPHARFIYAGLDPTYLDNSFLSNLGNPDINPEVTVSYEMGLKSKITKNFGVTFTAFYNDKYDYIVTRRAIIQDQTGRFVARTFRINQDYARIRGLELGLIKKFGEMINARLNVAYQVATGKSNSATESALQLERQGNTTPSEEVYLAWDRPWEIKGYFTFVPDFTIRIGNFSLEGFRFFISSYAKSGLRYDTYIRTGTNFDGRPRYEEDLTAPPFENVGTWWFNTDLKITRDFDFGKGFMLSASLEVRNVFNNKNAQIVNGVTGRGYEVGDDVEFGTPDPRYPHPTSGGTPATNPARYLAPRQLLFGIGLSF